MAELTTESAVRLRFHLHDTALVPTELVEQCVADAQARVLARLAASIDEEAPPPLLRQGTCLLAGSLVLHALAAKDAAVQKQISIGGQRLGPGQRFGALRRAAADADAAAWEMLHPYLEKAGVGALLETTPTQPVLGG